jgi:hypothetical protein
VSFICSSVDGPTLEVDSYRFALSRDLFGEDEELSIEDLIDLVDIVGKLLKFIFDFSLDEL